MKADSSRSKMYVCAYISVTKIYLFNILKIYSIEHNKHLLDALSDRWPSVLY